MTDYKELRTKKCSEIGCKMEVVSMNRRKYYCEFHFKNVRFRQKEHKYWKLKKWG